jgi:hypothetical protein
MPDNDVNKSGARHLAISIPDGMVLLPGIASDTKWEKYLFSKSSPS